MLYSKKNGFLFLPLVGFWSFFFTKIHGNVDALNSSNSSDRNYSPSQKGHWQDPSEPIKDERSEIDCFTEKQAMAFVSNALLRDSHLRENLGFLGDFMLWKIALHLAKKVEKNLAYKAFVSSYNRYERNAQLFFYALKKIQYYMKNAQEERDFRDFLHEQEKIVNFYYKKIKYTIFFDKKLFQKVNIIKFHENFMQIMTQK